MKKALLFFAMALACATGAIAQKQAGGEKNIEVQFAPLGGNPVSISGLRFRSFNADGTGAIRLSLFLGGTTSKEVTAQPEEAGADAPELITTDKSFSVSIRPGYEKHFAGTDRLSPYVGGEILFGIDNTTKEEESWDTEDGTDFSVGTTTTKDGTTTFGVNLLAGTDFYFADNLYLGAEIGFGFASSSDKDTDVSYDGPVDVGTIDPVLNGSSSGWGPNFQGTMRLGWLFN
jgi:opacity protein-like surface antigen